MGIGRRVGRVGWKDGLGEERSGQGGERSGAGEVEWAAAAVA